MARTATLADPATLRRLKLILLAAAFAIALYLPIYYGEYRVFQFTRVLVYGIAVLGLGMLTGYNGQISLGHGAFFAVGAYTSAILIAQADLPYAATLLPAALLTFLLGFAVGVPALRLHGPYLALVTLGVAVVTPPLLKRFSGLTGGAMGLSVPKPEAPAWTGLADDQWLYYVVLAVTVVMFALAANLVSSRVGRAMTAIRDDPLAAQTMGIELARVKTRTFAWSAMFAGVAGAMFAWVVGFVSPESFTVSVSIQFLAALVVGGLGTVTGPLFGAAFLVFVPNVSENLNDAAPGIAFGALLILVMYVAPGGIVGLARRAWGRLIALSTPRAPPAPGQAARPALPPKARRGQRGAGGDGPSEGPITGGPPVDATPRSSDGDR